MPELTSQITEQQRRQYEDEGYFILERVIPESTLEVLRGALSAAIAGVDASMDQAGTGTLGLNHRGKRYFIANAHADVPELRPFLFGELVADICRATIGPDAWLFLEQYVVKMAEVGTKFSWHQDSGFLYAQVPGYDRPYLTLWCALDDMTIENGTIYVLPFSRAGTREVVEHVMEEGTNDMVGYFGGDPGDPVIVPAGSIAVFSTTLFHRSGVNTTDRPRRSYVVQYSPEPIMGPDGTRPHNLAIPFLRNGEMIS